MCEVLTRPSYTNFLTPVCPTGHFYGRVCGVGYCSYCSISSTLGPVRCAIFIEKKGHKYLEVVRTDPFTTMTHLSCVQCGGTKTYLLIHFCHFFGPVFNVEHREHRIFQLLGRCNWWMCSVTSAVDINGSFCFKSWKTLHPRSVVAQVDITSRGRGRFRRFQVLNASSLRRGSTRTSSGQKERKLEEISTFKRTVSIFSPPPGWRLSTVAADVSPAIFNSRTLPIRLFVLNRSE